MDTLFMRTLLPKTVLLLETITFENELAQTEQFLMKNLKSVPNGLSYHLCLNSGHLFHLEINHPA